MRGRLAWGWLTGLLLLSGIAVGQRQLTGRIVVQGSREPVVYAGVSVVSTTKGTFTDDRGRFVLPLPENYLTLAELQIAISHVGFRDTIVKVSDSDLRRGADLTISIAGDATLPTVDVRASSLQNGLSISRLQPDLEKLRSAPALLGELDYLKALTLLPGISTGLEGTANVQIRGGNPGQTHLILDGITLYNAGHLGGFLSSVDPFGVKAVTVYKGGVPAQYGGRLSGVLDFTLRDGRRDSTTTQLSLGTATVRAGTEGPLGRKGSYVASGRYSYPSLLVNTFGGSNFERGVSGNRTNVSIFDGTIKTSWNLGSHYLSTLLFYSGDRGISQFDAGFGQSIISTETYGWGTQATALRYKYDVSQSTQLEAVLTASTYRYKFGLLEKDRNGNDELVSEETQRSRIRDYTAKVMIDYKPAEFVSFNIGGEFIDRSVVTAADETVDGSRQQLTNQKNDGGEFAGFVGSNFRWWSGRISIQLGARLSGLTSIASKLNLEPRASASLRIWRNTFLNGGYDRHTQYVHQLTTDLALLPNSVWLLSDRQFVPAQSEQLYLGLAGEIGSLRWSVEGFQKSFGNLLTLRDRGGDIFSVPEQWQQAIAANGEGVAEGIEFFVNKRSGRFNFWLAYTLSRSDRRYASINDGEWFPYTFDRTHDGSINLNYGLKNNWTLGMNFVYQTGQAITLPIAATSKFLIFDSVNNGRVPNYHRMDLSFRKRYSGRRNPYRKNTLAFSVYNAYNRRNPLDFRFVPDRGRVVERPSDGQLVLVDGFKVETIVLFPFIPGVSYTVEW